MKATNNSTVLVSVTNTAAKYGKGGISIKGRINMFGEPYSPKIRKGQEVVIIERNKKEANLAIYKATKGKLHIFELIDHIQLPSLNPLMETFNGFKKVNCQFISLERSLNILIRILFQSEGFKASTEATQSFSSLHTTPAVLNSHPGLHQIIKRQFDELKALKLNEETIISHLDGLLGQLLLQPVNPSITDTPLSLYAASLKVEVNYDNLLHNIKSQLQESCYFDFEYRYERGILFENLSQRQAILEGAAFINEPSFTEWLHAQLNPVPQDVTTRDLISAICRQDYDWNLQSVASAA